MFSKLVVILVAAVAIGAAQLDLRHQRLEAMHDMAQLHVGMDAARRQMWDLQVRIASHTQPDTLREAIARARLDLQPIDPTPVPSPPAVAHRDSR